MDINDQDNRGSTPLHWACYSKSEFSLSYILSLGPDLEIHDQNGLTPLHLAVRAVPDLQSTRAVRSLLLKCSGRGTLSNAGQSPVQMIKDTMEEDLQQELTIML